MVGGGRRRAIDKDEKGARESAPTIENENCEKQVSYFIQLVIFTQELTRQEFDQLVQLSIPDYKQLGVKQMKKVETSVI